MKNILRFIGVMLIAVMVLGTLSGCGGDKKADNGKLYVYNWGDYIDPETINMFEDETGIDVIYEEFPTNEDMYVKVAEGAGKYDICIPSEYMIQKMIDEDMLYEIDVNKLENYSDILDRFKSTDYDKNNRYCVPFMWGTVGIVYNTTMVDDKVDSWDIMWNPKYEKNIFMMDSVRDSVGVALKRLGYSMNSTDPKELEEAKASLIEQKPLVLSYIGDEGKDAIINEGAAMGLYYSGDAAYCISNNSDLAYAIPKEGTNFWFDAMIIPKTAQNVDGAYKFIDFMCREDIGRMNVDYIEYSSPLRSVIEGLPEEIKTDPLYYPSEDEMGNFEMYVDLGEKISLYDRLWTEVKAY